MEYLILSTLMIVGDWGTTRDIVKRPDKFETNIFLGKNPSMRKVDIWFPTMIAANAAVGFSLPKKYRKYFWGGVAIVETGCLINNYSIGLKVNFK